MKEAVAVENMVRILEGLEEGVEGDPEAHDRLLKLGEKISNKSDIGKKAADEFLKKRNSVC